LQRELLNELSKQILAGKVHKDSVIYVDVRNEVEFVFENIETADVVN
jgi:ATP-dependent Clp protease ATP-binding subunit ClpB